MGSAASIPNLLDKETFLKFAEGFDGDTFDAYASVEDHIIDKKTLLELAIKTDVYLSHDLGLDSNNKSTLDRVRLINKELKRRGLITWFDEEQEENGSFRNMRERITEGIKNTQCVLVFLTQRYLDKVAAEDSNISISVAHTTSSSSLSKSPPKMKSKIIANKKIKQFIFEDNCKIEFMEAFKQKGANFILPVILEENVMHTSSWNPVVAERLGKRMRVDMIDFEYVPEQLDSLVNFVYKMISPLRYGGNLSETAAIFGTSRKGRHYKWLRRNTKIDHTTSDKYADKFSNHPDNIESTMQLYQLMKKNSSYLIDVMKLPKNHSEEIYNSMRDNLQDNLDYKSQLKIDKILLDEKQSKFEAAEIKRLRALDEDIWVNLIEERDNMKEEDILSSKAGTIENIRRNNILLTQKEIKSDEYKDRMLNSVNVLTDKMKIALILRLRNQRRNLHKEEINKIMESLSSVDTNSSRFIIKKIIDRLDFYFFDTMSAYVVKNIIMLPDQDERPNKNHPEADEIHREILEEAMCALNVFQSLIKRDISLLDQLASSGILVNLIQLFNYCYPHNFIFNAPPEYIPPINPDVDEDFIFVPSNIDQNDAEDIYQQELEELNPLISSDVTKPEEEEVTFDIVFEKLKLAGSIKCIEYDSGFYEGEAINNKRNGRGIYTWENGSQYKGTWLKNLQNGTGVMTHSNGDIYDGEYFNGKKHGRGQINHANGDTTKGKWSNGIPLDVYTFKKGPLIVEVIDESESDDEFIGLDLGNNKDDQSLMSIDDVVALKAELKRKMKYSAIFQGLHSLRYSARTDFYDNSIHLQNTYVLGTCGVLESVIHAMKLHTARSDLLEICMNCVAVFANTISFPKLNYQKNGPQYTHTVEEIIDYLNQILHQYSKNLEITLWGCDAMSTLITSEILSKFNDPEIDDLIRRTNHTILDSLKKFTGNWKICEVCSLAFVKIFSKALTDDVIAYLCLMLGDMEVCEKMVYLLQTVVDEQVQSKTSKKKLYINNPDKNELERLNVTREAVIIVMAHLSDGSIKNREIFNSINVSDVMIDTLLHAETYNPLEKCIVDYPHTYGNGFLFLETLIRTDSWASKLVSKGIGELVVSCLSPLVWKRTQTEIRAKDMVIMALSLVATILSYGDELACQHLISITISEKILQTMTYYINSKEIFSHGCACLYALASLSVINKTRERLESKGISDVIISGIRKNGITVYSVAMRVIKRLIVIRETGPYQPMIDSMKSAGVAKILITPPTMTLLPNTLKQKDEMIPKPLYAPKTTFHLQRTISVSGNNNRLSYGTNIPGSEYITNDKKSLIDFSNNTLITNFAEFSALCDSTNDLNPIFMINTPNSLEHFFPYTPFGLKIQKSRLYELYLKSSVNDEDDLNLKAELFGFFGID